MFVYEKKLQYPVKIANPNPKLASIIVSQFGGPNFKRLQEQGDGRPALVLDPYYITARYFTMRSSTWRKPCLR